MEWYRQVQFISAVPMPREMAAEFGTTVNGMWAPPGAGRTASRALFSVPLIALTPTVYEDAATAWLLDEVCQDINGERAQAEWYYWEPKPVYSACIYSDTFRGYLLDMCRRGVDAGMDVVNLDEIMASTGLMNRRPRGSGWCHRCLSRFRRATNDSTLAATDDAARRAAIAASDQLYVEYRAFHELETFRAVIEFIADLRAYAKRHNDAFAISANVGYLGNNVAALGRLWGCLWGPHIDFVLMENDYRIQRTSPHIILPRGKFTAWYKLGASFKGTPTWVCPSIHVPRQLAGEDRRRYYELMFLEAYANGGRWGYYWWPGVDAQTRRAATAPDTLKEHIRFIAAHRDIYERATSTNELAVLYLDGPIMGRPGAHEKYLALAQALAETGHQFDVLYCGDGEFNPDQLDVGVLTQYKTILVPEARSLGAAPRAALERYTGFGGVLVDYSEEPLGQLLTDFWQHYRDADRERVAGTVGELPSTRIRTSHPAVNPIRYALGDRQIVHLLNYDYVADSDSVTPARDLRVRMPWNGSGAASATYLTTNGEKAVQCHTDGDSLVIEIPELDLYGVVVVT